MTLKNACALPMHQVKWLWSVEPLFALASCEPFAALIATPSLRTESCLAKEDVMNSWYDVTDVAALLKVSPRTVQRWCRERRVPHVRVGRGIRFTAEQLVEIETVYSRARALSVTSVDAPNPGYRHVTVVPMKRRPAA